MVIISDIISKLNLQTNSNVNISLKNNNNKKDVANKLEVIGMTDVYVSGPLVQKFAVFLCFLSDHLSPQVSRLPQTKSHHRVSRCQEVTGTMKMVPQTPSRGL